MFAWVCMELSLPMGQRCLEYDCCCTFAHWGSLLLAEPVLVVRGGVYLECNKW
jgi:hypothetical protein